MQFTITSAKGETHQVEAQSTVTPGLLITEAIGWRDRGWKLPKWHVTHEGTTYRLTGDCVPKKHARLIAGALGGLPIVSTAKAKTA